MVHSILPMNPLVEERMYINMMVVQGRLSLGLRACTSRQDYGGRYYGAERVNRKAGQLNIQLDRIEVTCLDGKFVSNQQSGLPPAKYRFTMRSAIGPVNDNNH